MIAPINFNSKHYLKPKQSTFLVTTAYSKKNEKIQDFSYFWIRTSTSMFCV